MDFASLMRSEISKSVPNKSTAATIPTASASSSSSNSKYLKRSELEAQREEAYRKELDGAQAARAAKASQKRKADEEEASRNAAREVKKRKLAEESRQRREQEEARQEAARRQRLGLPPLPPKKTGADAANDDGHDDQTAPADKEDIDDALLRTSLRALHEPTALFGETHASRLRRYRALTAPAPATAAATLSATPIPTTLALLPESAQLVPARLPPLSSSSSSSSSPAAERAYLFRQLASYFTLVLTEWAEALAARPAAVRDTFQGKQAAAAYEQSRTNMRPLFRRFEKGEVDEPVLEGVVEIVRCAQERRYVDASDAYLRLSIGKAAWPIGVTMVGIHERSAREKLHESDKGAAHIMSDEVTRKFLQSIKRCLSFAQTRWPPDDHLQLMG